MAAKLSLCCFVMAESAKLQAVSQEKFQFRLSDIELKEVENNLLHIKMPDVPALQIRGEPALPVLREAVVLPHESGIWSAKVSNVQKNHTKFEWPKSCSFKWSSANLCAAHC